MCNRKLYSACHAHFLQRLLLFSTLFQGCTREQNEMTRKMVPITGRERSFLLLLQKIYIDEGVTEQKQQAYQFTQGYNILQRLQVHHQTLTFIIHNLYEHYYLYTNIHM